LGVGKIERALAMHAFLLMGYRKEHRAEQLDITILLHCTFLFVGFGGLALGGLLHLHGCSRHFLSIMTMT